MIIINVNFLTAPSPLTSAPKSLTVAQGAQGALPVDDIPPAPDEAPVKAAETAPGPVVASIGRILC